MASAWIHPALREQFVSWNSGSPLSVRELATKHQLDSDIELVLRLIQCDLEFRNSEHSDGQIDSYLKDFPKLSAQLRGRLVEAATMAMQTREQSLESLQTQSASAESRQARSTPSHRPHLEDYELFRPIGHGSFGTVWLARGTHVPRPCAVKILNRHAAADLQGVAACRDIQQGHPHLIAIWHLGTTDQGDPYYVMPLADPLLSNGAAGKPLTATALDDPRIAASFSPLTLCALLKRRRHLSPTEVRILMQHLLRGLIELHEQPLCHYDVKPSNIVMVNGNWQLIDVGLATPTDEVRRGQTPAYCPNEQHTGPAADLYAVGKTAYVALTGRPPTEFQALPPDGRHWNRPSDRTIHRRLSPIINAACSSDPAERYVNGKLMLRDVDAAGELPRQLSRRTVLGAGLSLLACLGLANRRNSTPVAAAGVSLREIEQALQQRQRLESHLMGGRPLDARRESRAYFEFISKLTALGLEVEWQHMALATDRIAQNHEFASGPQAGWLPGGVAVLEPLDREVAGSSLDEIVLIREGWLRGADGRPADEHHGFQLLLAQALLWKAQHQLARGSKTGQCRVDSPRQSWASASTLAGNALELLASATSPVSTVSMRWAEHLRELAVIRQKPDYVPHLALSKRDTCDAPSDALPLTLYLVEAANRGDPEECLRIHLKIERILQNSGPYFSLLEPEILQHVHTLVTENSSGSPSS